MKANRLMTVKWLLAFLLGLLTLPFPAQAFYNPNTGRWLNRDPIEEDGGNNIYAFAEGCPVTLSDALGAAVVGKKPEPAHTATAMVLEALWTYDVKKVKPPSKKEAPFLGLTIFLGLPDPGLTIKDCNCGANGKSCGCGGGHLESKPTAFSVNYWARNRATDKYEREVNVAVVTKWWKQYVSDLNSLAGCVSRKCAACRVILGTAYQVVDSLHAKVEILENEVRQPPLWIREQELRDTAGNLAVAASKLELAKQECDQICSEDW